MKRSNILLSVALIVVAILAGCSNDSVYPAFPQSATITQTGDFMLGQEFDSSKFQVVVTYLDGSVKTLNNAVLTFTDGTQADGVTAGDKVSISVGTDYNGKAVKAEGTISRVYQISSLTASTAVASFKADSSFDSDGTSLDPALFTVTAKYGDNDVVLGASNYTVDMKPADSVEDMTDEELAAATELPAVATVTLTGNLAVNNIKTATVDVKASKEAGTVPSGDVKSIVGFQSSAQPFQFAAFDYETLPEIDRTKVKFDVKLDNGTTDGEAAVMTAEELGSDLVLTYVNKDGFEISAFDSIDFSAKNANDGSGIYLHATWKGTAVSKDYEVTIADTSIAVQYNGKGYIETTKLADIDLNPADFRVVLTVGTEKSILSLAADDFFWADSENATEATKEVDMPAYSSGTGCLYVGVNYNGVDSLTNAKVPSLDKNATYVDYTLSNMVVELDEDFSIAKQYYNESIENLLTADIIKSIKATTDDASVTDKTVTISASDVKLAYTTSNSGAKFTENEDFKFDETSLYVQVTYEYGAAAPLVGYAEVTIENEPAITSVELEPSYGEGVTAPAIETAITWNVKVNTADGYLYDGVTTGLTSGTGISSTDVKYYVDGVEEALPTAVGEEAVNNVVIKVKGIESAQGVNVPVGKGYVEVTKFTVTQSKDYVAYLTDLVSTDPEDYTLAETGYEPKGEVAESDMPEIISVKPAVTNAVVVANNTVDVTVRYLGKSGELETQVVKDVKVTGTAWVEGTPELKLGDVVISMNESAPTEIEEGTYTFAKDFTNGLTAHGSTTIVYSSVTTSEGTFRPNGATGFGIDADGTGTITIKYTNKDGEQTANFYVKGVEPAPEA